MAKKVFVLGDIDLEQNDFKLLAQSLEYQLPKDLFEFVSYDDLKAKVDVKKLVTDKDIVAIILGPSPHMMKGLDGAKSLSAYYRQNGNRDQFPYLFDLIHTPTSRSTFKIVFQKLKTLLAESTTQAHGIAYFSDEGELTTAVIKDKIDVNDTSFDTVQSELKSIHMDVYSYLALKPVPLAVLMKAATELDQRMGKRNPNHARKARAIYNLIIDDDTPESHKYKAEALFRDGICLYNGRGVRRNNERAKHRFEQAEKLDYVEATYMLYFIYKRFQANTNIDNNAKMAVKKLREASDKGYKLADFHLGEYNLYETQKKDIADISFHRYVQYCQQHKAKLTNEEIYRYAQCWHFGYDKGKQDIKKAYQLYTQLTQNGYIKGYYGLGLITLFHPELDSKKTFDQFWQQGITLSETRCLYAGAVHAMVKKGMTSLSYSYLKQAMQQGYVKALIMLLYTHWKARQYEQMNDLLDEANLTEDIDLTFIIDAYHKNKDVIPTEFEVYIQRELAMHQPLGVLHHANHIYTIKHEVAPQKVKVEKPALKIPTAKPTPPKTSKGAIRTPTGGTLPIRKKSGR